MLISPKNFEYQNGLKINNYKLDNSEPMKPVRIEVFLFEKIKLNSYTSQAEFFCRRALFNEIETPSFFVDRFAAWSLLELKRTIRIIILGEESKTNALKLIKFLCNKYKIPFSQLTLNFFDLDFIKSLLKIEEEKKIDKSSFLSLINAGAPAQEISFKLTFKTYLKGKWQDPIEGEPLELISLKVNQGELKYRVYTRNNWTQWIDQNSQYAGIKGYPIKGFQYIFNHPKYNLSYCCTFINGEESQWQSKMLENPYNRQISNFKFKIEEKK